MDSVSISNPVSNYQTTPYSPTKTFLGLLEDSNTNSTNRFDPIRPDKSKTLLKKKALQHRANCQVVLTRAIS